MSDTKAVRDVRVKCAQCGLAPNAIGPSGQPITLQNHMLAHVVRNIDRELFGLQPEPMHRPTPFQAVVTPDTRAVRERAAEIIRERGWTRGWYEDPIGRCSLLGALDRAARETGDRLASLPAVVELEWELKSGNLAAWNDAQSGPEPVIAALLGTPLRREM